jgi:hypothetical protein
MDDLGAGGGGDDGGGGTFSRVVSLLCTTLNGNHRWGL